MRPLPRTKNLVPRRVRQSMRLSQARFAEGIRLMCEAAEIPDVCTRRPVQKGWRQATNKVWLRQLSVQPSKIEPGDWLRDLGRYRQVASVDVLREFAASSTLHSVCFTDCEAADGSTLSIPESVLVTVWRKV